MNQRERRELNQRLASLYREAIKQGMPPRIIHGCEDNSHIAPGFIPNKAHIRQLEAWGKRLECEVEVYDRAKKEREIQDLAQGFASSPRFDPLAFLRGSESERTLALMACAQLGFPAYPN